MSDVQGVGLYTELNYKWAKNVSKQANKDIPKLKLMQYMFPIFREMFYNDFKLDRSIWFYVEGNIHFFKVWQKQSI